MIASAKGYDDPSPEDRERVKARWLASVAAAASVSALGEAARAASSSGWGAKAIGWVIALAAGAAGIYALLDEPVPAPAEHREERASGAAQTSERPLAAPAPAPVDFPPAPAVPVASPPEADNPVATERERVEPVAAVARPAPARVSAPARPVVVPEPVAPAPEAPAVEQGSTAELAPPEPAAAAPGEQPAALAVPSPSAEEESRQLGEETLLLSKIRRSLREGAPARALDELTDYRRRFEKPLLGMEAAALRVDALCRSGNVQAGRAEAELFQATWPSSPLEQRVRAACQ